MKPSKNISSTIALHPGTAISPIPCTQAEEGAK